MASTMDFEDVPAGADKPKLVTPVSDEFRQVNRGVSPVDATQDRPARPTQGRSRDDADFVSAFKLLKKAAETIDLLQDRCRRLEIEARDLNARLKSEAEASDRVILEWEKLANAFKAQLTRSEEALADALANAKMLEERAAGLTERMTAAEARAIAAEELAREEGDLASTFRDKILESFGSGSPIASAIANETDR